MTRLGFKKANYMEKVMYILKIQSIRVKNTYENRVIVYMR